MKDNKTQNLVPILLFFLIMFVIGGGIWYGAEVALPNAKANKAEQIRAAQEAEAAARLAVDGVEQTSNYDYSIPVTDEAISDAMAASRSASADDAVTVTTDENGDVWITRDWSNTEGLNETTPPDPNADNGGAQANMSSGGGVDIPFDSNGIYYEHHDDATNPGGSSGTPSGGAPSGNDANPGGGSTPTCTTNGNGGNPDIGTQTSTGGNGNTTNPGGGSTPTGGGNGGQGGGNNNSGNPKPGDTKTIDGQTYLYDSIFGWMPYGGPGVTIQDTGGWTELGETVENANF